jgi:UDP-N-acetyl-D-galactosamine dehydrogenase
MTLFDRLLIRKDKLSVTGLGYVGIPLAIAFAKVVDVVGYDVSKEKIELYNKGIDVTREVRDQAIKETTAFLTSDEKFLKECRFHIVAVPTPINPDKTPDLNPVISASKTVGRNLSKGSIVVYESTVYPGVTEEICVPILEQESGLNCGKDFKVGYSPERINPGDKQHRLETIVKVVAGMDQESLEIIAKVYEMVVEAGVYKAESIKVAEAAKVIENTQRDLNIALMNELSIIFNKMSIDTKAVLEAAATKWNFLRFVPGLVGGHCIGVDPYYLTYKAEQLGYHPQVILSGRRINDGMGKHVAENTIKKMIRAGRQISSSKVAVLGVTFKEDCPDTRNTKVVDLIREIEEYGVKVQVVDPVAYEKDLQEEYGISLVGMSEVKDIDALVVAVAHKEFKALTLKDLKALCRNDECVLVDLKGIFDKIEAEQLGYLYWRL